MFTIELRVNSTLVGHVYGKRIKENGERRQYEYEYYEPEASEIAKHTIWSSKDAPLAVLVRDILTQVMHKN